MTTSFSEGDRVEFQVGAYGSVTAFGVVSDATTAGFVQVKGDNGRFYKVSVGRVRRVEVETSEDTGTQDTLLPPPPVVASETPDYYGRKYDQGKTDYSILPACVVEEMMSYIQDPDAVEVDDSEGDFELLAAAFGSVFSFRQFPFRGHLQDALLCVFGLLAVDTGTKNLDCVGQWHHVVAVLDFGAKKYARDSWQTVPNGLARYLEAATRHLEARGRGVVADEESGLPHLAHAACCIMFCLYLSRETIL